MGDREPTRWPETMTRQEYADLRSRHTTQHDPKLCDICAVFAEIDALRAALDAAEGRVRLPVIATCGDCPGIGWAEDEPGGDGHTCCAHEDAPRPGNATHERDAPPDWCPLRGAT